MSIKRKSNPAGVYAPWIIFSRQVEALFSKDPEIKFEYDDSEKEIILYVYNPDKEDALRHILPSSRQFGNIVVKLTIIPGELNGDYKAKYFERAFTGNDAFDHLSTVESAFSSNPISYCVFVKEVVQYPNDNIGDEHGVCSTLYQDLAKEVFGEVDGVFFCTDVKSLGDESLF